MMVASEMANGIADSGHRYAMLHAASSASPTGAAREQMGGMTQVRMIYSDLLFYSLILTKIDAKWEQKSKFLYKLIQQSSDFFPQDFSESSVTPLQGPSLIRLVSLVHLYQ